LFFYSCLVLVESFVIRNMSERIQLNRSKTTTLRNLNSEEFNF